MEVDLVEHARALLASNRYLTLGTTEPDCRSWISPVYFAAADEREFYWVSATDARHSRNLADRPEVSLVVFDSSVLPYHGRALFADAVAHEVPGDELDRGLAIYPGAADRGATSVSREDVTGESPYRLYRATATDVWVLCPRDPQQPCPLHGLARDHRTLVTSA